MSSDYIQQALDSAGVDIIRNVLRNTGFQYEEPMGELDRSAARYALELYQQGNREPTDLIAAITSWAEGISDAHSRSGRSAVAP